MTHPTREEWMAFLYGELGEETKRRLDEHLAHCAECRCEVESWQAARRSLNDWKLPRRAKRRRIIPVVQLAAAAAVLVLAVVGATRLFSLGNDVAALRAQLQREVADRQAAVTQLTTAAARANEEAQSVVAELAKAVEEKREADQRVLLAALRQLQAKHAQDYAELRNELETVAVLTEAGLRQTRNEIANITYTPETK